MVLLDTVKIASQYLVAVGKNTADEPFDKALRHPGSKRELVYQQNGLWIPGAWNDAPLVSPQLHRAHRRLFNEALTHIEFQQRHVRIIDRQNPKQEDIAPEHANTWLNYEVT